MICKVYYCIGYIPRWQFKFGKTYKNECGVCLSEFDAMQQIKDSDKLSALAYPHSLPHIDDAVMSDANVREYLNELQNHGCKLIICLICVVLLANNTSCCVYGMMLSPSICLFLT